MAGKGFSVLDMAKQAQTTQEFDSSSYFAKNPVSGNVRAEQAEASQPKPAPQVVPEKKDTGWSPDASITKSMPELNKRAGASYNKEEVTFTTEEPLQDIADEMVQAGGAEAMNAMQYQGMMIEAAKKRANIKQLNIPDGMLEYHILNAAADTDSKKAAAALDEYMRDINENHPDWIVSRWDDPEEETVTAVESTEVQQPSFQKEAPDFLPLPDQAKKPAESKAEEVPEGTDVQVVVNKETISQLPWTEEELGKIRRARTIELNIREGKDLEFASIKRAKRTALDRVLAKYTRKANDIASPLPASMYRATFSGLTYPEMLDLESAMEINQLDGQLQRWTICFNHIHNQSIGPWEEYVLYTDENGEEHRVDNRAFVPNDIPEEQIRDITKFDDFLRKTSFIDLKFILWKILCATSMDQEIIQVICDPNYRKSSPQERARNKMCPCEFDWIYRPTDLLIAEEVPPFILENMEKAASANTVEDIQAVYAESPLNNEKDFVKLPHTGFSVIYGHVSAYDYIHTIFGMEKEIDERVKANPSTVISQSFKIRYLRAIKSILVPDPDDENSALSIYDPEAIMEILNILDEVDSGAIREIHDMIVLPFEQIPFEIRQTVCPKCGKVSRLVIDDPSNLLFILSSLRDNVTVTMNKS